MSDAPDAAAIVGAAVDAARHTGKVNKKKK